MTSTMIKMKIATERSFDSSSILQPVTKLSIIDDELNRHGMGRYQWLIWAVCGTGYFLDLMWYQAIGLVAPNIQRELGFSDDEYGNLMVVFGIGITAGGLIWGLLVDIVGRRVAFFGTLFIAGVFGMCLGAVPSYDVLLAIVAFVGFGIGGNVPVDATITLEYLPKRYYYLLTALSIFLPLGAVVCTLIAFGLVPRYSCSMDLTSCHLTGGVEPCCSRDANMGWRYLIFTAASITLGVFIIRFFIFPFYESPRYLISKGNDEAAVEVIHNIAAFNKRSCDLTVESLYKQSKETPVMEKATFSKRLVSEASRLKLLFGCWRMARVTILVWITWMFSCWGFTTAGTYMPLILQQKNNAIQINLKQTYVDYVIIYTPAIAGAILSVLMIRIPSIGRKWTLVFSCTMMGVALFLYCALDTQAGHVGFNMLQIFFQCYFCAALFGWTPEAFPTAVRGTAAGLASFFGNLFGIIGPFAGEQLFSGPNGDNVVLYMSGGVVFVSTIALLCIPTKDMVAPR